MANNKGGDTPQNHQTTPGGSGASTATNNGGNGGDQPGGAGVAGGNGTDVNGATASGGAAGAGGNTGVGNAGSDGASVTFSGSALTNNGTIAGGGGGGGSAGAGASGTPAAIGGAGGAGGIGLIVSGASIVNTGQIAGGGGGGSGESVNFQDVQTGPGGAGGIGVSGNGLTITNSGTIAGGGGGSGGGTNNGGAGGTAIAGNGLTITNSGRIQGGGNGRGVRSINIDGTPEAKPGAGISGSNLTIVNSGTISGGGEQGSASLGAAVNFTGGSNTLTLQSSSQITGAIVASGGTTTVTAASGATFARSSLTINGGTLTATGGFGTSAITVNSGGTFVTGGAVRSGALSVNDGGTLNLGSAATLNVTGNANFVSGSTLVVGANAAGEAGKISATEIVRLLSGATVKVLTGYGFTVGRTYTIMTAGKIVDLKSDVNVSSNYAFVTPSLSADLKNIYLSLAVLPSAFENGGNTYNQRAVGKVLDMIFPTAPGGDFGTVLNALSLLDTTQGPQALVAISGLNYAGWGAAALANGHSFMSAIANQTGPATFGTLAANRVALAADASQVCYPEVTCDSPPAPSGWSAWIAGLGNTGNINANAASGAGAITYGMAGTAVGADYQIDNHLLAGFALGYGYGTQWTNGLPGQGTVSSYQFAAYGTYRQEAFYAQAVAGYAYNDDRATRTIAIPGLAVRTATGHSGSDQLFGQLESGYRMALPTPMAAAVTPFARLQGSSVMQRGFAETGAGSLDLTVAPQLVTSLRSILGVNLTGTFNTDSEHPLAIGLRVGWLHDYADMNRPVTAAFMGMPSLPFTVLGATPQRDGAEIGMSAEVPLSSRTALSLMYSAELANGATNHTANLTARMRF